MSGSNIRTVQGSNPTVATLFNADTDSAVPAANALTISGGVGIETTGSGSTVTIAAVGDLAALEALATTGIVTRTASETYATRTITGTASRLSVSDGDGVSANPTLDIDSSYIGQATITTLGTITTGTWTGTDIAVADGGSGRSIATAYAVLCGGTAATGDHQSIDDVGISGQVLTSNGAGVLPTMQDAGGSGGLVWLSSQTASTSASINFTTGITSTYDTYFLKWTNSKAAADGNLSIRVSNDAGISYETTNYESDAIEFDGTPTTDSSTSQVYLQKDGGGTSADEIGSGFIYMVTPASAGVWTSFYGTCVHRDAGATMRGDSMFAMYKVKETINAIQFIDEGGNIDSGTFDLYGVKNS